LKFASTNTRWWLQAIAVSALLAGLFLSGFLSGASGTRPVYAQALRGGGLTPRVPLAGPSNLGSSQFLPPGITRRGFPTKDAKGQTRVQLGGANGSEVPEKTVDVSGDRLVGSDEVRPFWSPDGSAIFFEGNASFVGGPETEGYQLYRTPANTAPGGTIPTGLLPTRLTNEPGADYRFPVVNTAGNRVAFARRPAGSSRFDLYVATIPTNPVPGVPSSFIPTVPTGPSPPGGGSVLISLTNSTEALGNPQAVFNGRTFADVERATFVGASTVVFSARLSSLGGGPASPYHLFTVDINELRVRQLTDGTADERNPSVSPDGRFVAFDSNATPGSYSVGNISALVPAISTSTQNNRNIFTIGSSGATGPASDVSQVRVFSYDGANTFSNVQPAWSRLDPNDIANPNSTQYYLAFASTRRQDGAPAGPGAPKDIYYIIANNTVLTTGTLRPETAPTATPANVARRLDTADDRFEFDDEYPTFPPFRNVLQIGFHSDRRGTQAKENFPGSGFIRTPNIRDIFVATLFDIDAPTLLRWDTRTPTGEIVHINVGNQYDANPNSAVRNREQGLLPGTRVFFTVRAEDLGSGIDSVYLQFKNPNSKYQSAAQGGNGVEHKEYDPGTQGDINDVNGGNSRLVSRPAFTIYEGSPPSALLWQIAGGPGGPTDPSGIGTPSNVGREYEAEAINAENRTSYINHRRNRGNKRGVLPIAGFDDFLAFSGGTLLDGTSTLLGGDSRQNPTQPTTAPPPQNPPDPNARPFRPGSGAWLKLQPLNADQQATVLGGPGGRLYGASWEVPQEASDWYMDVILFDTAVNPANPSQRSNWIIYDNVWGFSTAASLSPQSVDLLVVMDHALGQKFFSSRFGSPGDALARGINNLPNIYYGVESYYTDPEVARYPDSLPAPPAPGGTTPRVWDPLGPFVPNATSGGFIGGSAVGTPNPLGVNSYLDTLLTNEAQILDVRPPSPPRPPADPPVVIPVAGGGVARLSSVGRYSIWRVLSRGPVPVNLLTDYLPTRTTSPPDQFPGPDGQPLETTPRTTLQSNRMVIWASPFTANMFVGAGSILDLQTQDNLRNYVNQGGRLFISGQDIGYALSGNGQSNLFFADTLKAQFVSDTANLARELTRTATGTQALNQDAFGGSTVHAYSQINPPGTPTYSPPNTLEIANETFLPADGFVGDSSFASDAHAGTGVGVRGFLDVIAPINGAVAEYTYGTGGGAAMISSGNANGGRVVYMSAGFEGISNSWYTYGVGSITFVAPRGRRAELMHNITCALRTSTISGRIQDQANGGANVSDVLVRAIRTGASENEPAAGTGFTDANGFYQIQGLPPGQYQIFGLRAGYSTDKQTGEAVHGASRATVNLNLTKAQPGNLGGVQNPTTGRNSGGVFRSDDRTPIPNITINAYRIDATQTGPRRVGYTARSSDGTLSVNNTVLPAGQYSFASVLPLGDYVVIVNPRQIVNAAGELEDNPTYNPEFATVQVTNPPQPQVVLGPGTIIANNLVQVRPGQTAQIDFRLGSSPQKVTGRVLDQNGNPLAGAIVGGVIVGANPPVVVVQSAPTGPTASTT
jgi:hypothetical protein